ncbi:hypothetical protein NEOC84_001414|nr:hypothetical protein [Neochlamydia sp. AcF84]
MIEFEVIATQKHVTSGRPKAEQKPSISSYHLKGIIACTLPNKLADTLAMIRL